MNDIDAIFELLRLLKARGKERLAQELANEAPLAFDLPPIPKSREDLTDYGQRYREVLPLLLEVMLPQSPFMRHLYRGKCGDNFTVRKLARQHVAELTVSGRWELKGDAAEYAEELATELTEREARRTAKGKKRREEEAEIQSKVASAARRKKTYEGGTTREETKNALVTVIAENEGLNARLVADMVETTLARTIVLGLLKELVEDGAVEVYGKMLDREVNQLHRLPDEFSGMTARELAAHPLNLSLHCHHFTTIAARIRAGLRPRDAIATPKNQGGAGVRRKRLASVVA